MNTQQGQQAFATSANAASSAGDDGASTPHRPDFSGPIVRLAETLLEMQEQQGLDTLEKLAACWARRHGMDDLRYVDDIARSMSMRPLQVINLRYPLRLRALVQSILDREGVAIYSQAVIESAVYQALTPPNDS